MSRAMAKRLRTSPSPALVLILLLGGCTTGRVVSVEHSQSIQPTHTTIALAPQGGIFADLIGIELAAQGYRIVDTGATLAILVFEQMSPEQLFTPEVLAMLQAHGIDALLVVQKTDGADGLPQTVRVRLHSTVSMTDVGSVNWENGWFRRGVLESAQEIAAALS